MSWAKAGRSAAYVLAGIVVGLGAAFLFGRQAGAGTEQQQHAGEIQVRVPAPASPAPLPKSGPSVVEPDDPEATKPENARLANDAGSAPAERGTPEAMDPVRHAMELRRRHDELIARERAEPVDPAWAPTAARRFENQLTTVAEIMRGRLNNVHCATTLCTATVEWSSYAQAKETHASLLHAVYEPNCAVQLLLPEPADQAAAYQATAVFDCKDVRAN